MQGRAPPPEYFSAEPEHCALLPPCSSRSTRRVGERDTWGPGEENRGPGVTREGARRQGENLAVGLLHLRSLEGRARRETPAPAWRQRPLS